MSNLMDHIRKPAGKGQKTRKVELTGILRQLTEQYARGRTEDGYSVGTI
jgi:hypothetical protein